MLNEAKMYAVLAAQDVDRLKQFLLNTLELKPGMELMGMWFYDIGGSQLFIYESPFAGTNQATAISFDVPNLAQTVEDLKARGVVFEHYDMPGVILEGDIHVIHDSTVQSAWFKDTEGNIFNITQSEG